MFPGISTGGDAWCPSLPADEFDYRRSLLTTPSASSVRYGSHLPSHQSPVVHRKQNYALCQTTDDHQLHYLRLTGGMLPNGTVKTVDENEEADCDDVRHPVMAERYENIGSPKMVATWEKDTCCETSGDTSLTSLHCLQAALPVPNAELPESTV